MALYEIDTLKQSLKKYVVVLALGTGVGLYLGSCAFTPAKRTANSKQTYDVNGEVPYSRPLTPQEQRLAVFESYTRK